MVLLCPFCCRTRTSFWAAHGGKRCTLRPISSIVHFWITAGNQGCSEGNGNAEKTEALLAGSPLVSSMEGTNMETLSKCLSSLWSQEQVRAHSSQRQGHISSISGKPGLAFVPRCSKVWNMQNFLK